MSYAILPTIEMYGPVYKGPGADKYSEPYKLKRLSSADKTSIEKAKKYAMEQNIRTVLLKQTRQHEVQQQINIKRSQAMVLLSRIYVGSINYDVKEDSIRQAFTCFGPVKNVNLSYDEMTKKHMGFAFLEFEYPEAAQLALNQNSNGAGLSICGRQCKVGRPTNMPHSGPLVDELLQEANQIPRIYVANVHPNLNSDDLKSVFEAFGVIESCQLLPDLLKGAGKHRGFGFIQYETHQAAHEAISGMNMFDLGGQLLRVGRAITPANLVSIPTSNANPIGGVVPSSTLPAAAAVAAASITAQIKELEVQKVATISNKESKDINSPQSSKRNYFEENVTVISPKKEYSVPEKIARFEEPVKKEQFVEETKQENVVLREEKLEGEPVKISGSNARTQMMQKLWRIKEERTMMMTNMLDEDELDESIEDEVMEECTKFGEVENVKIIVDETNLDDRGKPEVRIFVGFTNSAGLEQAVLNMNGRFFGGRIVKAVPYDQELFDAADYTA